MDSDVLIIGRAAPPANIMGGMRRGELRRISPACAPPSGGCSLSTPTPTGLRPALRPARLGLDDGEFVRGKFGPVAHCGRSGVRG